MAAPMTLDPMTLQQIFSQNLPLEQIMARSWPESVAMLSWNQNPTSAPTVGYQFPSGGSSAATLGWFQGDDGNWYEVPVTTDAWDTGAVNSGEEPVSAGPMCTETYLWEGYVANCGTCKALVKTSGKSCLEYCADQQLMCIGAWEESNNDCVEKEVLDCTSSPPGGTSDLLCECVAAAPVAAPTTPPPTFAPYTPMDPATNEFASSTRPDIPAGWTASCEFQSTYCDSLRACVYDNGGYCPPSCKIHSDCEQGSYCDDYGTCHTCQFIVTETCDAFDSDCCSALISSQCAGYNVCAAAAVVAPAVSCETCPSGFFDGCNQCTCGPSGAACTYMFCATPTTPKCNAWNTWN